MIQKGTWRIIGLLTVVWNWTVNIIFPCITTVETPSPSNNVWLLRLLDSGIGTATYTCFFKNFRDATLYVDPVSIMARKEPLNSPFGSFRLYLLGSTK